jgi:shikimate kinase/3-dehydroquinate synthase
MSKSISEKFPLIRPIVLIGMMGAGKTSVGRALAALLDVPFFDADTEIEAAAGCSVAQIFADYGEAEFRRMERLVIARLLDSGACILSLGGGAFMDETTRQHIKRAAVSVWIKVDREILLQRVMRHDTRPLLRGGNPEEKLTKILAERAPVYAEADLIVVCDDRPVTHNARHIEEAIRERERK